MTKSVLRNVFSPDFSEIFVSFELEAKTFTQSLDQIFSEIFCPSQMLKMKCASQQGSASVT